MSFVTAKSSSIRLWLFVTLIGFSKSQDISSNATRGDFNFLPCSEGKFECQNKECIESELLCDGKADCLDSSDETEFECSKPELICPDYAFRCTYGACIDKDLVCNGQNDCIADGSDEDNLLSICYKQFTPSGFGVNITGNTPGSGYGGSFAGSYDPMYTSVDRGCFVPFHPRNGQLKLRQISDTDDIEYIDPPSSELKTNSSLVYTCDPGYKIRGNPVVTCVLGQWSRKPVCIEIRCRPLASESTMANCTHASGRVKPCSTNVPVRPATRAEISCRPGYKKEFLSPGPETVECNKDGRWDPEPIRCVPVCGVATSHSEALVPGGTTANSSAFPWHAALYVQENSLNGAKPVFRCDVTVIQANLLLTTAQCVSDFITSWDPANSMSTKPLEVLDSFSIRTANTENDSLPQDPQLIGKHRVKNVHTTCNIHSLTSLHSTEIAIIELHEPLQFSDALLPACLDEIGAIQQILEAGSYEGVSRSRGLPTSGYILKTTRTLESPYSQCVTLYNATRNPFRVNNEKFCDIYDNGTSSCVTEVVNNGGGLVFEVNNLWYLMGIVSHIFSLDMDGGERLCDRDLKLLYNKMSKQMTWIQQVISNLEHYKYPPCSRYLPPFHTKPTTPVPIPTTMTMTESTPTTTPTSSTVQQYIGSRVKADSCSVPPQLINGQLRLHEDFCESNLDCSPIEGTMLGLGSQLVYSCDLGYRLDGNADVYCRANGNWSAVPVCTEITCLPLKSMSMAAICSRFDEWVDCSFPVLPNTQAKVSCRSGYRVQMTQTETVECNMDGNWEPAIPQCVPVCGATFGRSQLFEAGEITGPAYPWHATLYTRKNTSMGVIKEVRCGATLIQSNLLLTAAHCVYNEKIRTTENPGELFILMSNIHRHYDSPLHNFHFVRRGTVKTVHVHCNYHGKEGNYVADIALLELEEPFEFFNIQLHPACLDFSGYNARVFGPGSSGEVIGFGKTALGEPSDVLQTISVPYVSQTECENSNITPEKQFLITNDKFCAGYTNGTSVCLGEGGGGLFLQINGLWFVMGVVSVDLSVVSNDGRITCGGNGQMLYTKVSDYMAWILDVMFHLERYKSYPPCNGDSI